MAVGVRRAAFVGREDELARLERALETHAECPGLFVAGGAGIGKTSHGAAAALAARAGLIAKDE